MPLLDLRSKRRVHPGDGWRHRATPVPWLGPSGDTLFAVPHPSDRPPRRSGTDVSWISRRAREARLMERVRCANAVVTGGFAPTPRVRREAHGGPRDGR